MADHSTIEWTDATWNPVTGCSVVSPGCTNCYAMRLAGTRLKHIPSRTGLTIDSKAGPVWNGKVRLNEEWLDQPLRWKKPRMIFVCAHGDLFHESVPDEWIDRVFAVMALAPQHTFQVLTKRAKRMREYLTYDDGFGRWGYIEHQARKIAKVPSGLTLAHFGTSNLPNVWLGVSAEDQARADERIPDLLATPAAIRFVSAEPLIGPVHFRQLRPQGYDLDFVLDALTGAWSYSSPLARFEEATAGLSIPPLPRRLAGLDWIIVGGESGQDARPMHPDWARSSRDQCTAAGVPFFFKQWGSWAPHPHDVRWHPGSERLECIGKKRAGRLLDGIEHNGMPEIREVPAI